ncbi:hypothetical protein SMACR_03622 [Sordaria macrospora]|uniref:WGS project CABT00000000 data, contig 2.9 n=2 Tax=Sordaria macrospora TaxID=5147 RepID=F7VVQ0_SORMK|nr:uncharacterized protein SMAC_03622 [Sordaria macrospora k-hell]KAA8636089.1 hypothetical protein SMACR_03622 [Sordaria macrospora]KAH7625780.1 hypothetical protein B0T09DRAFT_324993 [Sordaria sp. MPI-SDFR-AT-0083]WPJ66017.1 hypothetical protein SMAC4_03622 [Sordaria macrospora]CCC09591.1 unnamed protein product [Sordaria macrospora k-hell]
MQLTTLLTGALATFLTLGSTASAAPASASTPYEAGNTKRVPTLGGFRLSTADTCPMDLSSQNWEFYTVNFGAACGECTIPKRQWTGNGTETLDARTISDAYLNPKCQITLFQKTDCSDPGIVSGSGCWAPEGGIKAYKISCPWWEEPAIESGNWLRPCYK